MGTVSNEGNVLRNEEAFDCIVIRNQRQGQGYQKAQLQILISKMMKSERLSYQWQRESDSKDIELRKLRDELLSLKNDQ